MLVSERREYPSSSPGGSLAFGAAARVVVIAAGKLPERSGRSRVMVRGVEHRARKSSPATRSERRRDL